MVELLYHVGVSSFVSVYCLITTPALIKLVCILYTSCGWLHSVQVCLEAVMSEHLFLVFSQPAWQHHTAWQRHRQCFLLASIYCLVQHVSQSQMKSICPSSLLTYPICQLASLISFSRHVSH